jgi:hypothetical protein
MLPQDIIEIIVLQLPKRDLCNILRLRKNILSDYFWARRLTIDYPGWVNPLTLKYKHLYQKYARLKTGYAKYFKIQDLSQEDFKIVRNLADLDKPPRAIHFDINSKWLERLKKVVRDGDIIKIEEKYYIWYKELLPCEGYNIISLPPQILVFDEFPINYWSKIRKFSVNSFKIDPAISHDLDKNPNKLAQEYILFNGVKCIFIDMARSFGPSNSWEIAKWIDGIIYLESYQ